MARSAHLVWVRLIYPLAALAGVIGGSAAQPREVQAFDCENDYCDTFWFDECKLSSEAKNCNLLDGGACETKDCTS